MIGNDIIDLEYTRTHTDWTRRGYLDKIFSASEQNYIAESEDSFSAVWRLWSMKESVYKLNLRSKSVRSFKPSKIECNIIGDKKGIVNLDGVEYNTITTHEEKYIFSSATLSNSTEVNHHIIKFDNEIQENYYTLIKDNLAFYLDGKNFEITISKNKIGIPEIYLNNIKQRIYLSITHHGSFLAWSTSSAPQLKFPI